MSRMGKPVPGSKIDWSHPISRNLKRFLLFNENGGSCVLDSVMVSGKPITSASNPLWVSQGNDRGVSITSGSIQVGPLQDFTGTSVSVACWILYNGGHGLYPNLFSCYNDSFTSGFDVYIRVFGSGLVSTSEASGAVTEGPATIAILDKAFICVVYDGVASFTTSVYVNGKLATAFSGTNRTSMNNAFLGNDSTSTYNFDGHYYQFAMWDRALNSDEVAQLQVDRYCIVQSPQYRKYFIPAAAAILPRPLLVNRQAIVTASYI